MPIEASTVKDVDSWDIHQKIDEGLGSHENNDEDENLQNLRRILKTADTNCQQLLSKTPHPMKSLDYQIFQTGQSALRRLANSQDQLLVRPHHLFPQQPRLSPCHYRACAALLWLHGHPDAAHEVLLGVTLEHLDSAEYAATHRGQTTWAQDHPLTDSADLLHAALHRLVEGSALGEGHQSGYANAQYWLAGGPKLRDRPARHPVRASLTRIAQQHTPRCVARVMAPEDRHYTIPAGGGKMRTVCVPCGQWDDYAFLELCRQWAEGTLEEKELEEEVTTLQRAEIILLLRYELFSCWGRILGEDEAEKKE
jgi:hypothetical protein